MNPRNTIALGMILMASAVALGAFGAHALKSMLIASGRTETFELAIRYLMFHALALIVLGTQVKQWSGLSKAAWLLVLGIFLFCGSLIVLSLTDQSLWGAVAPIGGSSLIAGWLVAAWTVFRSKA